MGGPLVDGIGRCPVSLRGVMRRAAAAETRGFVSQRLYGGDAVSTTVDAQSALRHSAAWACQRILVSTISKMPVDVFRRDAAGQVEITAPTIVSAPSGRVSRRGWVAQLVRSGLQHGNMYGRIVSVSAAGFPSQIETVSGEEVAWNTKGGQLVPFVNGRESAVYPAGDLWHVPVSQFLLPGSPVAMSPTQFASRAIATGLAAEEFGHRFFTDGGHPTTVWSVDGEPSQDMLDVYAARVMDRMESGSRKPLFIGSGVNPKQLQVDPANTQWIDIMRFEVENAARFWGVPPSMIYGSVSGQNVTYANVSQADLAFLKTSVEAWIIDLEDAWSALLPQPRFVKFNTDAVLRMDTEARFRVHEVALRTQLASVNELRAYENRPPWPEPEYDRPGIPASEPASTIGAVNGDPAVTNSGT